jgi:AcrR family transcriptional regulator
MSKTSPNGETRQQILHAALKRFANGGYAATSVQQIVGDVRLSKPTLYYYFPDKAGLFQALVNEAYDERYRLMREAAKQAKGFREKLVEILSALFDYFRENRELMRISFATAFAAPGEVPSGLRYSAKSKRNFEFIHSLMKRALASGELNKAFDSRALAFGFYGQMNLYLMAHLIMPGCRLNRETAEGIVNLFLTGAASQGTKHRN